MYMKKKKTFWLIWPLSTREGGGGLNAIVNMSAKNLHIVFERLPLSVN